jgi:hypothetical protein
MTKDNRRIATVRLLPLLLAFSFLVAACGQSAAPTATVTPPPTAAPPTATPAPSPTPAPPTATPEPSPTPAPTSTPMPEIDLSIELPGGDPEVGRKVALKYQCYSCHVKNQTGPSFETAEGLPRIIERGEVRIADPAYAGRATTNQEYILESILLPEIYIVSGDWEVHMDKYLRNRITEPDLAEILAWLDTFE